MAQTDAGPQRKLQSTPQTFAILVFLLIGSVAVGLLVNGPFQFKAWIAAAGCVVVLVLLSVRGVQGH